MVWQMLEIHLGLKAALGLRSGSGLVLVRYHVCSLRIVREPYFTSHTLIFVCVVMWGLKM